MGVPQMPCSEKVRLRQTITITRKNSIITSTTQFFDLLSTDFIAGGLVSKVQCDPKDIGKSGYIFEIWVKETLHIMDCTCNVHWIQLEQYDKQSTMCS